MLFDPRRGREVKLARALILCIGPCLAGQASASDGIYSETSHALFGAFTGGVFTWASNTMWPEHRVPIGFAAGVGIGILVEKVDKKFSVLDAGAHTLGAALGALITDEFVLAPVIKREAGHAPYVGVLVVKSF